MTPGTYLLLEIMGSATLLLWGIRMASTAVMRAHGPQIRRLLPKTLGNRFHSVAAGVGAAAILQSSTAVAVFLASLAGTGAVPLVGGLAAMLGADIGSAVVAALLAFNLKGAWPALIFAGYVVHALYSESNSRLKQHGRFGLGLGLILIALTFMSQASGELAASHVVRLVVGSLSGEPFLAVLALAILTWLAHSSIAMLLFLASLANAGIVSDPELVSACVLGINLGGGMPAMVLTWRQSAAARRITVGNALFRLAGAVAGLAFLGAVMRLYESLPGIAGFRVVLLHIIFNLAIAVVFLGLLNHVARLMERWIADTPPATEEFGPRYIPPMPGAFQAALPLSALTRETLRICDVVQTMLTRTLEVLLRNAQGDNEKIGLIRRLDDRVDTLYKAIRGYTVELMKTDLPDGELARVKALLRYALNLENAGDIIDKSLLHITAQKRKARRTFSSDGDAELTRLFDYVSATLQLSADVVMGWKADEAKTLADRKREFKTMAGESAERHLNRLRCGVTDSLETSTYHLDIVNDLQRINSLFTAVSDDVRTQRTEANGGPESL